MALKIAIVGCGKIADGHVEEIAKLPPARVVAVCDLEILMAEQLASRYGIPNHYDDVDKMLAAERPDVVHITTPPQSHLALAVKALDAGCHILVEKPVGVDAREVEALIGAVERAGKKLTAGYTYVFDPPALALRRMLREGILGEPVHVESYYGYDLQGAFGKAMLENPSHWVHKLRGGIIQNNLDHVVNKITEILPDENPRVGAVGYRRSGVLYGDSRDAMYDELRAVVIGEKISAYATLSSHGRPVGHFLRVYGTKRTVHVDFVSRTLVLEDSLKAPGAIGRLLPPFDRAGQHFKEGSRNVFRFSRSRFHFFAGLNRLLGLFYQSILDRSEPPISYGEILRVARLMDRILDDIHPAGSGGRGGKP
jgi:predicted dehydrogenase